VPAKAVLDQHARWLGALESALERTGTLGAETVGYLHEHRIRIGVRSQSAGARWTVDRRIEIHPRYAGEPDISPYTLSLVIHEVRHLQQGLLTALSVYGELDAWRIQFGFLGGLAVPAPGSESQRALIQCLLALPRGWDRGALSTARQLMRAYAGKAYRVDLLPLFPLHHELAYAVTRRMPLRA
jgi:hypothetical protein